MWWQRVLVVLALAAPVVIVVVVAWPEEASEGEARPGAPAQVGDVDAGDLADGVEVDVDVPAEGAARFAVVGTGTAMTVRAEGRGGFDSTLTVVDGDGNQLAYNDDTVGLDPEVEVALDDGQEASVEVRSFSGEPGTVVVVREDG
jgi:hypothetical protein